MEPKKKRIAWQYIASPAIVVAAIVLACVFGGQGSSKKHKYGLPLPIWIVLIASSTAIAAQKKNEEDKDQNS